MSENKKQNLIVPDEKIINRIFLIRSKKVMLDFDLATLYEVEVKKLNQAVKRNINRFPDDFMFQLNRDEYKSLRSQFVTLETGRGQYSKYLPYAFTEQGVAMLSSVLNSNRAIEVNIQIIRTFIKLREILITNKELREKIEAMEAKYDKSLKDVFEVLKRLLVQEERPKKLIGFNRK